MTNITDWPAEDWSDRGVPSDIEVRRHGDTAALWDRTRHVGFKPPVTDEELQSFVRLLRAGSAR